MACVLESAAALRAEARAGLRPRPVPIPTHGSAYACRSRANRLSRYTLYRCVEADLPVDTGKEILNGTHKLCCHGECAH